jgi:hypothetical protein
MRIGDRICLLLIFVLSITLALDLIGGHFSLATGTPIWDR